MKTTTRTGANHPLHWYHPDQCGMWAPIWTVAAVVGRRTTVHTQMPQPYQGPYWGPAGPNHNPYREGPR